MNDKSQYVQGSLFEEDYLLRTLGPLVHTPDIALTELVANAWDAGATLVEIFIPDVYNQRLIIEDNGVGITKDEFHSRWMKLGYNRVKHQGKNVIFPPSVEGKRLAYGRNGIGRHGLLCFNSEYKVITNSKGEKSTFVITTQSEIQPFVIKSEGFEKSNTYGTRLEVVVTKNLPDPNTVLKIISARFLHDPKFVVSINKKTVPLEEHAGLINSQKIKVKDIDLLAHFIDSQKSGRSTLYQGIAFWQGGRLVGEPSWILGHEVIVDGRTKFAKRYTVVVKSNDLADFIFEDWTGFKDIEIIHEVYKAVSEYVNQMFLEVAKDSIEETKQQIKSEFSLAYSELSPLSKYNFNEAVETITISHPTAKQESVALAVEAVINLEKSRSGKQLLLKLSQLSENDIDGLNEFLNKWSVRDALTVLDEIDKRISIIEAIRKLSKDENVDELHVLHPLVTEARWLFGPEFESAEYVSNRQLQTAAEKVFHKKINKSEFNNSKKRPDIIVVPNSILSITGTESFDNETDLVFINKILIIELKRGKFKLTKTERNQAQGYVEDFVNCGVLIGKPYIDAYVVGDSYAEKLSPTTTVLNDNNKEMGKVKVSTFSQLVDTAERRLFGLRQKLNNRYEDVPGMELFRKQDTQLKVNFKKDGTHD